MRFFIAVLAVPFLISCSKSSESQPDAMARIHALNKTGFTDKAQAQAASTTTFVCEQVVQIPLSRGQGSGLDGKYRTETRYFPAYLRGDVNNDGKITADDGKMATQRLFKLENIACQATADIAGYPDRVGQPDGAVTSIDITQFNEFRHSGIITWSQDTICSYACEVLNQPPGSY